ncbi:MAG: zinc ABC transporter substrate-binding protein [Clostridia bacterium]|nr:zinc ABC transporter substrate-binding protein [Clostridia bacterium]
MKKQITKIAAFVFAALMILSALSGCAGKTEKADKKVSVVCTIFPIYDWVRNLVGDRASEVDIKMLIDNGVDLHNFQPTADDIVAVSDCDIFIYVGGESDKWVDDVLATAGNKDMKVIDLLSVLGDKIKEEEVKDGMEAEEEHEEGEEEGPEYDEHVWLSLKNAETICKSINEALCAADPEGKEVYTANWIKYSEQLATLEFSYQYKLLTPEKKTLVFADRFPFRYLLDDYGIDYYAAFVGCSTESEASFETIVFLAKKLDELGLKHVIVIEGTEHKIAESVIANTEKKDMDILTLDSMQGITSSGADDGLTYLSIMENNLKVLEQALN